MATINIGSLSFTHKGDYASGTTYAKNDVVYYSTNGNAYVAKQATTGNAPTSTAHWDVFAAGSGGIWNAGLSLGSANQVAKVNAAGNALEFGTLSSDFVRLASLTPTSQALSFSIDGYFTSDYDIYKIYLVGVTADAQKLQVQVNQSGSPMTGSSYVYLANYADNSTGNTASNSHVHSVNDNQARIAWNDNEANRRAYCELTVYDPLNTNRYKRVLYQTASYQSSYYYNLVGSFAWQGDTNALSGLTIKGHSASYNVSADHVYVYGLKNS
tara:strand:- start:209 stop:1018 length:810 start_codon:yes stop_codon:yes gene_type:complete